MRNAKLRDFGLDTDKKTWVIAEIGINHQGDLDTAKRLIDSVAKTGADAVKFQTYRTETRAPEGNQEIYDILKGLELPFEAFFELKTHAEDRGLFFFSTPFCVESVDALEAIDCAAYKAASFDVTNHTLLQRIAATGKAVIMSVGMADMDEVKKGYDTLTASNSNISLLHCISSYPLKEEDANLAAIHSLHETFSCPVGYSDHTSDIFVPLMAVATGAQIIEKHYKIDDDFDCIDAPVSISQAKMTEMVREIRRIEVVMGSSEVRLLDVEKPITVFRRTTTF